MTSQAIGIAIKDNSLNHEMNEIHEKKTKRSNHGPFVFSIRVLAEVHESPDVVDLESGTHGPVAPLGRRSPRSLLPFRVFRCVR
jgi:hypothetical protein